MTSDEWRISCSGQGCHAEADASMIVRPMPSVGRYTAQPIDGWLFVPDGGGRRHYCPACLAQYVQSLRKE